jgi:hypothetical protein
MKGDPEEVKLAARLTYFKFIILRKLLYACIILLISCNSKKQEDVHDDGFVESDSLQKTSASGKVINDTTVKEKPSSLQALGIQILHNLKNKDAAMLASFIHPEKGIRFSPYGYVDTLTNVHLPAGDLVKVMRQNNKLYWGSFDGSGDSIKLTVTEYFSKFIYDVDFINAEKISVNKTLSKGNSLNNLTEIYRGAEYIEYYFSAFDKQYGGMDWRSLRLVFENGYLVGIVHDQWTS